MRLEIRKPPPSPLQDAWDARVEDWIEGNRRIRKLREEHRSQYREKICSKCSPEQRVRRSCTSLLPHCDELNCRHMRRAFSRKHKKLLDHRLEQHPFFVRIRLNEELKKSQEGTAAVTDKRPRLYQADLAHRR